MNSLRATYSIDGATAASIERTAVALGVSKSEVVRRAVLDFESRRDRLTAAERRHLLDVLAQATAAPPTRDQGEVEAEIAAIRRARREAGGRRA